ncbi:MAG: DUF1700 domain-containing protein [Clostridia bacterium]|nr:DUF1700 domain-containing protein [Clostridia bacterium]
MTKKVWDKLFLKALSSLPHHERKKMLAYYDEIFSDKLESGSSEAEILAQFGAPEECARRILNEQYDGVPEPKTLKRFSVGELVGLGFLTLLLIIPLASVAVAVLAVFGACCLSGGVFAVGGVLFSLLSPFFTAGMSAAGVIAQIGSGIALSGVGALLFVGFFFLTKYLAVGVWKAFKFIYVRRVV